MVQYSKRFISLSIYLFCSIWPGNGIDLLFNRQRLCDLFLFSLNIHCSLCFVMILRCVWRKDLVSQIIVTNSLSKETYIIVSIPKYKIFHNIIIICCSNSILKKINEKYFWFLLKGIVSINWVNQLLYRIEYMHANYNGREEIK